MRGQDGLRRDYGGGPPADAAFELVPAVANTHGGWHPLFAQWWRGAVRTAAERSGPTANQSAMLWRSVGFLSVILQRQNFQVLIGCIPGAAELVEGLLGRPLSEEPEFWRAAPEPALEWGADEFDLPPPVPIQGDVAEEEEFRGASGHLRAAGLRL